MKQSLLFEEYSGLVESSQKRVRQVFFAFSLFILVYNFVSHAWLYQIGNTPLVEQEIDPTYWIFMLLDLPELFNGIGAIALDGLLLFSCLGSFIFTKQTITCWVFFICQFIYFVLYNLLGGHHNINIGLLFMSFPFVFASPKLFTASFTFCRFIFCFMLTTAALWKIGRGNLSHIDQGATLLLLQHKTTLFTNDSFRFQTLLFFVQHRVASFFLWVGMILLESLFLIGFITWKKDHWLLISYSLFFVGGWFFFDIYFVENLLFLLTLSPVLNRINNNRNQVLREKQQHETTANLPSGLPLPNERSSSRH